MKVALFLSIALLAGCAATDAPAPDNANGGPYPPTHHAPPPDVSSADCPVTGSGNWQAWVNAMPGPDSTPKLIVTGDVTVPTGGYSFGWTDLRIAESYPVQVFVRLTASPPSGPATQAVTTQQARGEWPVSPPVGAVTVQCGGTTLARIAPVETAR